MFPHMYKVRPGRSQQVKEPGMAADCQWQRGENWRRNSNKWGSQGWESNSPTSGGSSASQCPPAIPAPPPDPQDNLVRKMSSPLPSIENEKSVNGSVGSNYTSFGDRGQTHLVANGDLSHVKASSTPERRRQRVPESKVVSEVKSAEENAPTPTLRVRRRSRGRPSEETPDVAPEVEVTYQIPLRRRSRSRQRQEVESPTSAPGVEVAHQAPLGRRSRSSQEKEEETPGAAPEVEVAYQSRRSRSRQRQEEETPTVAPEVEVAHQIPLRRRSRSGQRQEEVTPDVAPEAEVTYQIPLRRRSRSRQRQEEKTPEVAPEAEVTHQIPLRRRSRSSQEQDEEKPEAAPEVEVAYQIPLRRRSRSRQRREEETTEPVPQEATIQKSRTREDMDKPQKLNGQEANESYLRSRTRNQEEKDRNSKEAESSSTCARRRIRSLPHEPQPVLTSPQLRRRFRNEDEDEEVSTPPLPVMPPLPPQASKQSSPSALRRRLDYSPQREKVEDKEGQHVNVEDLPSINTKPKLSLPDVVSLAEKGIPVTIEPPTPVDERKFPEMQDAPEVQPDDTEETQEIKPEVSEPEESPELEIEEKYKMEQVEEKDTTEEEITDEIIPGPEKDEIPDSVTEEKPEESAEDDKMIIEQTITEEDEDENEIQEEEDEITKATRLWLLSQALDSDLLGKVLPDIEDNISYKVSAPKWWDPDEDETKNQKKVEQPKTYDDWDDEPAVEEPQNFTSFTSIKLRSTASKSPPTIRSRRGRILGDEPAPPAPPPPPPPPPPSMKDQKGAPAPPPPPPPGAPLSDKEQRGKNARLRMVDQIKKAARTRPDWKTVLKDIEGGIKLRKVSSSDKLDRSKPILPKSRGKGGKFCYESEKPAGAQSQLLGEIQRGVRLKHVRTNDRSKPDFNKLGLKKLRRQLTVEEKKSVKPDALEALPSSSDEEEDIDKMRDDLAATKSQLAEEIKKKKKLETEHKILKIDLDSLQAEVKKMKKKLKEAGIQEVKPLANGEADAIGPKLSKSMSRLRMREDEMDFSELDIIEEDIKLLNDQIEAQRKRAEKAEQKSEELAQKLQVSQTSADEWELRSVYFEKKYKSLQKDQGIELPDINCVGVQTEPTEGGPLRSDSASGNLAKKSGSRRSFAASLHRMESFKEEEESEEESSSSEEDTLSDHPADGEEEEEEEQNDEEGEEENEEAKQEERDFIMLKNKLSHMKDKDRSVRKERNNLRERINKYYKDMKAEREQYLKLKTELKELSDQMKDIEDDDVEDDGEESNDDDSSSGSWCGEKRAPQKPNVLQKKEAKEESPVEEEDEEDIVDLSGLELPQWSESEAEESESDEDDEDPAKLLKSLKARTKKYEERVNRKKKQALQLKMDLDQCDEMYQEEKRRHARLENELHMLLADI